MLKNGGLKESIGPYTYENNIQIVEINPESSFAGASITNRRQSQDVDQICENEKPRSTDNLVVYEEFPIESQANQ